MTDNQQKRKWALIAAAGVLVLAALPQVLFVIDRGREWHGSNAAMHPDEVAYSAYLASLIRGRARRNDPYLGQQHDSQTTVPESLFSIQMVPAYVVVIPSRWLGISADTAFIVFVLLSAIATSLAIFWLMNMVTEDARLSAASVWIVLGLGTLIARQGLIRYIPNLTFLIPMWLSMMVNPPNLYHLPFLRFYQPVISFPLFFVLSAFVWIALTTTTERKAMLAALFAGMCFAVLVLCYFFLWTAAAAWLVCIAVLWLVARKEDRRRVLKTFSIVAVFGLPAIAVFFMFLSHRAATVDDAQALILTHRPDLFRLSEIVALVVLLILAWRFLPQRHRGAEDRQRIALFAASLCFAVLAIFNQQIVTGRSLQPIHYEWFIGNYLALMAVALVAYLLLRKTRFLTDKQLAIIATFALIWGGCEVLLAAHYNLNHNRMVDELKPVGMLLTNLAQNEDANKDVSVVMVEPLGLADQSPIIAPQAVLWAPRMLVFPGVSEDENRERFFQQLYYLGFDSKKFDAALDTGDWNFYSGLYPYYRLSPVITGAAVHITAAEMNGRKQSYLEFVRAFDRKRAASPTLSYLVVTSDNEPDYSNLDRWYERDAGEKIGKFVLYRLKLRN